MHRVKGLEFPYVMLVSINHRVVLLHVAATRAEKSLYISSYGEKSEFLDPTRMLPPHHVPISNGGDRLAVILACSLIV